MMVETSLINEVHAPLLLNDSIHHLILEVLLAVLQCHWRQYSDPASVQFPLDVWSLLSAASDQLLQ